MSSKIALIIQREFINRVRKKSFLIMTILGPILSAALFILPAYFATLPDEERVVVVLDEPVLMDFDKGKENLKFNYLDPRKFDLEDARRFYEKSGHYAFLYIPPGGSNMDPDFITQNIVLYSMGDINFSAEGYIEDLLEKYIQKEKLKSQGVDPEVLARTQTKVDIRTINIEEGTEKESLTPVKMGIGYIAGFLIYLFVFIYGAQIMRGVIEEKTSRIVEVMISSVKPFELMFGKIIGLASVALLQFLIWLVFGIALYFVAATFILGDALEASKVAAPGYAPDQDLALQIMNTIGQIDFPYIIGCFLFFFMFGYLLYAALFAAIGSAVDKESDTQQFMFPVSLPLIASIIVLIRALDNPDGSIAFWFSIIPFTSPIVMMARIPFSVPWWELALSMVLLVGAFLVMTWLAGRIYRTGILMYGKKPRLKEILKWITYRH